MDWSPTLGLVRCLLPARSTSLLTLASHFSAQFTILLQTHSNRAEPLQVVLKRWVYGTPLPKAVLRLESTSYRLPTCLPASFSGTFPSHPSISYADKRWLELESKSREGRKFKAKKCPIYFHQSPSTSMRTRRWRELGKIQVNYWLNLRFRCFECANFVAHLQGRTLWGLA